MESDSRGDSVPESDPAVRVTYRLTAADYRSAMFELAQQSVPTVAFGSFIAAVAIIPVLTGDLFSLVTLVFGLAVGTASTACRSSGGRSGGGPISCSASRS